MIAISTKNEKQVIWLIRVLSFAIPVVVAALLSVQTKGNLGDWDASFLVHVNAVLNTLTTLCLIGGFITIKSQNQQAHRKFMMTAFLLSAVFLVSYVVYHAQFGHVSYGGEGTLRIVYFAILITHILLSAVVVPLVLFAVYYALSNQLEKHKKMVQWTFPVWLYVGVSGVTTYVMLTPYI